MARPSVHGAKSSVRCTRPSYPVQQSITILKRSCCLSLLLSWPFVALSLFDLKKKTHHARQQPQRTTPPLPKRLLGKVDILHSPGHHQRGAAQRPVLAGPLVRHGHGETGPRRRRDPSPSMPVRGRGDVGTFNCACTFSSPHPGGARGCHRRGLGGGGGGAGLVHDQRVVRGAVS